MKTHRIRRLISPKIIIIFLSLTLLVFIFLYVNLYITNMKNQSLGNEAVIIKNISRIMILPDEIPKITSVKDLAEDKLTNPDYYKNTTFDSVLLNFTYGSILYDTKKNKILNFFSEGIFNRKKREKTLNIEFRYNGKEEYRVKDLINGMMDHISNFTVIGINKSKVKYKEDFIYQINIEKKDEISELAGLIGNGKVLDKLDPKEAATTADVIITFRDTSEDTTPRVE